MKYGSLPIKSLLMCRISHYALFLCIIFFFNPLPYAYDTPKNHGEWWADTFGAFSPNENNSTINIYSIFERVMDAADKQSNRSPSLIILKKYKKPAAFSLSDGTVVLSSELIETINKNISAHHRDSVLAFIIGHELAHLSNDDFWNWEAFSKTQDKSFLPEAKTYSDKEKQADYYGLLYMTMAGYDPLYMLNEKHLSKIFSSLQNNTTSSHPTGDERAEKLITQIKPLIKETMLFNVGVRLYQMRRYDEAEKIFDRIANSFPSREIYSNMGMCSYMKALYIMRNCADFNRFYTATSFGTSTLAENLRSGGQDCRKTSTFEDNIKNTVNYLSVAYEKDKSYLPSGVNLTSALIISGKYYKALGIADEILERFPESSEAINNKNIALYLSSAANSDTVLESLNSLAKKPIPYPPALFNIATIYNDLKIKDRSNLYFKLYIESGDSSFYSDKAYLHTGIKRTKTRISRHPVAPPLPLGKVSNSTKNILKKFIKTDFETGNFSGSFYTDGDTKILTIGNYIEYVDFTTKKLRVSDIIKTYGKPISKSNEHMSWNNFSIDTKNNNVLRIVLY